MNRQRLIVIGATLTFGMTLSTLAAGASLDVNTGLWEVSSTGETSGTPPIPPEALARLPPEQRAQIQASIASAMAQSNKPTLARLCITEKTLQRGMDFNQRESANCKRSVIDSSSTKMNIRLECTGDQTMNGTFHIEALNRQTIRGNLHMVVSNGGNAMTVNRDIQGRWLSADCGTVKPADE
jgi:hypothetical protein